MASPAKLTVRLTPARGHCGITWGSVGRFNSTSLAGIGQNLRLQPVPPQGNPYLLWVPILQIVVGQLEVLGAEL
jgi:hypothetical protein